jgi:antitoxin ParD1/3/4
MESLHLDVALTQDLTAFVHAQAMAGGYGSPSEYVQTLIREALHRKSREELAAKLLEGVRSGDPIEVNDAFWQIRREKLPATARIR